MEKIITENVANSRLKFSANMILFCEYIITCKSQRKHSYVFTEYKFPFFTLR